jgi:deoxyribonuclease-4
MATDGGLLFGTAGIPLSSGEESTEAGIERVHELGLGCMEVEFVRGVYLSPEDAGRVGELARARGIRLSAHAPYFVNLNAREPKKVAASRHRILQAARMTSLFGGASVVFHAAFYLGDSPSEVYSKVKQNLEQIVATLRAEGIGVQIRPEVTGKGSSFGTLEEVLKISADVEGVAPAIDFPHWHARTGKENSYDEFADTLTRIETVLGRDALDDMHIHISGIEYGPKGETKHLTLAESDFNYVDLLRALKDRRVKGLAICESPIREEDALTMQEIYSRL